jgi:hypothetical protein
MRGAGEISALGAETTSILCCDEAIRVWERWSKRAELQRLFGVDTSSSGVKIMQVQEMLASHPDVGGNTNDALLRCIEECYSCAQACTSCADSCLAEPMIDQLRECIRFDLDCADICAAAGSIASRRTGTDETGIVAVLDACKTVCGLCGEECERHASQHEHCRICARACRSCEQACRDAIQSIRSVH